MDWGSVKSTGPLPVFEVVFITGGEYDFLSADRVHFLANDVLNVVEHAQPERQERVHAGHFFVDVSGTDEELCVFRHFVFRCLTARLGKKLGLPHVKAL